MMYDVCDSLIQDKVRYNTILSWIARTLIQWLKHSLLRHYDVGMTEHQTLNQYGDAVRKPLRTLKYSVKQ